MHLLDYLPIIPDFPKPGIMFRDISPLLADQKAFSYTIARMYELVKADHFDYILGIESRGFIFGAALAQISNKGLVLARKPNKLPKAVYSKSYGLEYGNDALEIQRDVLPPNSKILLIDDVLATGGTLIAANHLIKQAACVSVGALVLLEISQLAGAHALAQDEISLKSLLTV
jgi:adenine phosphoribosyltransferase